MAKNLFLTGEKQVGKSTLLDALIRETGLRHTGFRTMPLRIDGVLKGHYFHGFVPLPPFVNDSVTTIRVAQQGVIGVEEVFETLGVRVLTDSLAAAEPFILMDELGRQELKAKEFSRLVEACLDSPKRVIGVLQKKESPLLDRIKNREDTLVLTVTTENRDSLLPEIRRGLGLE